MTSGKSRTVQPSTRTRTAPSRQKVSSASGYRKPLTPIVQDSTPSLIASQLREAIAAGEFRPGEQLAETALAASLGVSRGPLRVSGVPMSWFVRADGSIAAVHAGPFTSADQLRAEIRDQLGVEVG